MSASGAVSEHVVALKERAELHFRCGGLPEALALCKLALTLAPGDREARQMLEDVSSAMGIRRTSEPGGARALPALERFLGAIHEHRGRRSD